MVLFLFSDSKKIGFFIVSEWQLTAIRKEGII